MLCSGAPDCYAESRGLDSYIGQILSDEQISLLLVEVLIFYICI